MLAFSSNRLRCWRFCGHSMTAECKAGIKNAIRNTCEENYSEWSTSRAALAALILDRAVLGQKSAGIQPCIPIHNIGDARHALLRAAKEDVSEKIRMEAEINGEKPKHAGRWKIICLPPKKKWLYHP